MTVLALPTLALASPIDTTPPDVSSINDLATAIFDIMWIVFVVIAVVMFVVAGILFVTSQGQPEKVAQARQAFIWGIAGVVVAIIAYSIVAIVIDLL